MSGDLAPRSFRKTWNERDVGRQRMKKCEGRGRNRGEKSRKSGREMYESGRQRQRFRGYHRETKSVVATNPCKGLLCIILSACLREQKSLWLPARLQLKRQDNNLSFNPLQKLRNTSFSKPPLNQRTSRVSLFSDKLSGEERTQLFCTDAEIWFCKSSNSHCNRTDTIQIIIFKTGCCTQSAVLSTNDSKEDVKKICL